ncbi:hypothetical protein [Methylosinus sp. Sm6]|uniref:hypothetical protein n=1 Tax=Methylosinus sp. Sm6 TaxID=2866948 RepID=UPI001C993671|nr:hypothetical protein [Methylosinus sp. Sm6]MBY6242843.1 hypothetical protein [Methylosinus sp. Sm6]
MASPSRALVLRFSTDLEPAKRGLADLARTSGVQLAAVATSAIGAARTLDATSQSVGMLSSVAAQGLQFFAVYKVAMLAATAGVAAFGTALEIAAEQVEQLQHIARGSEGAGVSSTFFQVWRNQAAELNVEVRTLEQALTHAKQAVRETVDDSGKDRVNSIGRYLDELYRGGRVEGRGLGDYLSADSNEQKINAVLEAMRELLAKGREIEALHLAEMLTGAPELAEKLTEAVRAGKMNVSELVAEAQRSGTVFDENMVQRAGELDDRLRQAKATMAEGMLPILKDLGGLGLDIKSGWVDIEEVLARVIVLAGKLYQAIKSLADLVPDLGKGLESFGNYIVPQLERLGIVEDRATREGNIARAGLAHPGAFGGQMTDADRRAALSLVNPNRSILNGYDLTPSAGALDAAQHAPAPPKRPKLSELETASPSQSSHAASSSTTTKVDQVESYLAQLRKSVEVLQAEADAQGKSNLEKEKAVDLAKAEAAARERGTPLTEQERAEVEALAAAHANLRKKIDATKTAEAEAREQMQFFGNTAIDALTRLTESGSSFNDVLRSIVSSLAQAALKAALLGEGSLASLFGTKGSDGQVGGLIGSLVSGGSSSSSGGSSIISAISSLFSGLFAEGGTIPAGGWGIVGENGPEPVYAGSMPVSVMPNNLARSVLGSTPAARGGGASSTTHNYLNLNVTTPDAASFQRSEAQVGAALSRALTRGQRNL